MEGAQLQPPPGGKYIRFAIYFLVLIVGLLAIHYFSNREEINRDWKNRIEARKNEKCLRQGGEMISTGCGIANCTYKCVLPYDDGGKACSSSSQCSGRCVASSNLLPEFTFGMGKLEIEGCARLGDYKYNCPSLNLAGSCEKRQAANCENFWELNGKGVSAFFADCKI